MIWMTKDEVIEINKRFDKGVIVNKGSLDFAVSVSQESGDWVKQCAYLLRAVALDHVFEEGNKRTAAAIMASFIEIYGFGYDAYKLDKVIVDIILKSIRDIDVLRRRIKDAIK